MTPLEIVLIALNGAGVLSFINFLLRLNTSLAVIQNEIKNIKIHIGMTE